MTSSDNWLRGLFAFGGAVFCAWLSVEARKTFEQNWRENNHLGVFVSAGTMTAAQAGLAVSLKELFQALGVPKSGPYLSRKKRNPLLLPYEPYPT